MQAIRYEDAKARRQSSSLSRSRCCCCCCCCCCVWVLFLCVCTNGCLAAFGSFFVYEPMDAAAGSVHTHTHIQTYKTQGFMQQLLRGLDFLHKNWVLHRCVAWVDGWVD